MILLQSVALPPTGIWYTTQHINVMSSVQLHCIVPSHVITVTKFKFKGISSKSLFTNFYSNCKKIEMFFFVKYSD